MRRAARRALAEAGALCAAVALCFALALLTTPAGAANHRVRIELSQRAEKAINARLTRRLIALELADIDVPPAPEQADPSTLFYRVSRPSTGMFRVELWELGQLHGARDVAESEAPTVEAQRVALAAAALARELRSKRQLARANWERDQRARADAAARAAALDDRSHVVFGAGALGHAAPGLGWLAGALLEPSLRWQSGARLALGAAFEAGRSSATTPAGTLTFSELRVSGGFARTISGWESARLHGELLFSAGVAGFSEVAAAEAVPGATQAWTARTGLSAGVEVPLSGHFALDLAPEAGVFLRRMPVEDRSGAALFLGSGWFGLRALVVFDPAR